MRLNYRITLAAVVLSLLLSSLASPAHAQTTPRFSDLTFNTSSDGMGRTYFPSGTTQIFARWNFQNIPAGSRLRRQWFRNGMLFIEKEEAWTWGVSGRLTNISIYDFNEGLTPGYYQVVITLIPYTPAAQVSDSFFIESYPRIPVPQTDNMSFSDLSVSTTSTGPAMNVFPAGTTEIHVRWSYANIPVGAIVQRVWHLNNKEFRIVDEPWRAEWGSNGRLTHISIYDYDNGLPPGNYLVNVFLRDDPKVSAGIKFTIAMPPAQSAQFSNLSFSASSTGPSTAIFPRGTMVVYARWDYTNVSPENRLVRRWYRNGTLWLEREEPWLYGPSGTVQNISVYDYDNGLLPGDYYVEISLKGMPSTLLRGYFTIA